MSCLTELSAEEMASNSNRACSSLEAGRRGADAVRCNKRGISFVKGGRVLYNEEYGPSAWVSSVRGAPNQAVLHIADHAITVQFASSDDCIAFVLGARAYSAYDKVCMICSLPPVDKEVTPTVSIVNALIQAGSVVEPYVWVAVVEVCDA